MHPGVARSNSTSAPPNLPTSPTQVLTQARAVQLEDELVWAIFRLAASLG